MQVKGNPVPFWVCRPGAVIEFEVFKGEKIHGVVKALAMNGPRSFLAILSESTEDGVTHEGSMPQTQSLRAINVSHAKRVIEHSKAELTFEPAAAHFQRWARELSEARAESVIVRRGHRLVIDGNACYAPSLLRSMLYSHLEENRQALGIQPWEIVDFESLNSALFRQGVAHAVEGVAPRSYPVQVWVNTRKLKPFLKRNINRFKCNTRAEEKAQEAFEAELYAEEMNREGMSGYPY